MNNLSKKRKQLYKNLISDGYFRESDGRIIFSERDFCSFLDKEGVASKLYANLLNDGYFRDEDGHITFTETAFVDYLTKAEPLNEYYPITENQRGIYIDWEQHRDSVQYNTPIAIRFSKEKFSLERLVAALKTAVDAHSYIKTRLALRGDDVVQLQRNDEVPNVLVEKCNQEPDHAFFQSRVRPFDLYKDDLYRLEVYETDSYIYYFQDFHHIIFDGLSISVFFNSIFSAYAGNEVEEEDSTSFDFAVMEAENKGGDGWKEACKYFDGLLSDAESLDYPDSIQPDSAVASEAGHQSQIIQQGRAIKEYCLKNGITESNYFMTVMLEVMHRLTREEKFQVCFVSNGRNSAEYEHTLGMFVKTLPVVFQDTNRKSAASFSDLVKEVQSQTMSTISRDYYPFTEMVERNGIRSNVLYAYQGGLFDNAETGEDSGIQLLDSLSLSTTKVPLDISFSPDGTGEYTVSVEYDKSRYAEGDIKCMVECMAELSCQVALHPECPINSLSLLSAEQEADIKNYSCGNILDVDESATFVSSLVRQATETPDAIAVKDDAGEYTYAELDNLSNAVAKCLVDEGVSKNDFVSIMLGYQKEFLVAAIGIEKSGGAYVPLDYDYPNDRLLFMLEDSESKVLITTHPIYEEKNAANDFKPGSILFIDDFIAEVGTQQSEPINRATPEGLAYMIYTSGSTGKPKGVMISHRAKNHFVTFIAHEWGHTAQSHICCHSSFSFDASIEDLYPVLTVGGTLFVVPQDARKDMELLHKFIIDNKITGGCYTTQLGQLLLSQYPDIPLDYLVVGGEKMTANPDCGCRLINTYGPTEFTVDATFFTLEKGKEYRNIPIGRPLDNLSAYVLDLYGHPLPKGMAGELCLSGPQMASGYWKRQDLTEEKFTEVTLSGQSVRIYHTGDLVRYNSDNQLEYLGRIDNQVKLRGFRIELGEIESRIASYPQIKMESVVVKTVGGTQHLCAYYSASEEIDKKSLREYLAATLTDYMVPTVYTQMEELPMTPNGKINTKALPEPRMERLVEFVAPESETEQKIADTMREVLVYDEPVGRNDGFYALGGDSIKAIRMVSALRQNRISLTVAQIIKYQTVSTLAEKVEYIDNDDDFEIFETIPVPIEESFSSPEEYESVRARFAKRGERIERAYPLTPMQQGMLLAALSDPNSNAYHSTDRIKLGILPTKEQLSYALNKVLQKHDVLRTSIIYKGVTELRQAVVSNRALPLSFVDISSESDLEAAIQRIDDQEFSRFIDLQWDSLLRLLCIKTGDNSCELIFTTHHTVIDGWCNALWMGDFFRFLIESVSGNEHEEDFSSRHGRYERHVRDIISRDSLVALDYWRNLLVGYDTKTEIPAYEKITDENRSTKNELRKSLSSDVTSKLEKLCRDNGCTVNNAVEAAWGLVLQAYNRTNDSIFVKVVSGRDNSHEDMSDVVGLFINSVPVRVRREADSTLLDLLKSCHNQAAETSDNDWVPLSEIQQQSELGSNLFQSILAFENFGSGTASASPSSATSSSPDVLKARIVSGHETNVSEITLVAFLGGNTLTFEVKYDISKYTSLAISQLLDILENVLTNIANSPNCKVTETALVSPAEAQELLQVGKGEDIAYDRSETFVDQFLRAARQYPDSVAIVDADSSITYGELDAKSDVLASHLISLGVGKDIFVSIMLPRVKEFVVAVLGVWKAGGAYLPLGSEYPKDRLKFMLEDAESSIMLTESAIWTDMADAGLSASTLIKLDEFDFSAAAEPVNHAVADGLAYMIYTSGSTGKPKGTMLEHANLRAFNEWLVRLVDMKSGDIITEHASFSFDGSCLDLYPALTVGGTVHILNDEIRRDMPALVDYFKANNVKGCFLTTRLAQDLLNNFDLPLEYLMMGGEKNLGFRPSKVKVYEVYGPTETTILATFGLTDQTFPDPDNITIGRPAPNLTMYITDANGNLVPQGMAGELCIAGPQVARGYWKRADLTAEKFVTPSFDTSVRMYRTGDLCRWDSEGNIMFLGRIDNQVKLRGFRIEFGEVESAMSKIAGITTAVVDIKTVNGTQHLVAYYTSDTEIDVESMRVELSKSLTDYMVPTAYVRMDAMPLTPNGKVNRKELPLPVMTSAGKVLPETPTEGVLYRLTTEMLKTTDFGVTDDLFRFGMTSILGMRLVMRAEKLGLQFKLNDLMQQKTIRSVLQQSQILATWIRPYDAHKPVAVLVCGETYLYNLKSYVSALSEHFNVFAFDPLDSHYPTVFFNQAEIDEVVDMYSLLLEYNVPGNTPIAAFCGHCFGGEISYRLAKNYITSHDNVPLLQLLDVFWNTVESNHQSAKNTYKLLPADVIERNAVNLKKFLKARYKWDVLKCVNNPTPYEGKSVMFRATLDEPMPDSFVELYGDDAPLIFRAINDGLSHKDNDKFWHEMDPNMEIDYVEADHMSMLEEPHTQRYLKWLLDNL